MIEISYSNVMNGLNKGIHMTLLSFNRQESDRLFYRAIDIWHIDGFSQVKKAERSIEYGPGDDKISIRFKPLDSFASSSWRGFYGVFLIHPEIKLEDILESRIGRELEAMNIHNQRHLDKWRA